jgi:glycosyltransferase involved in cell wall biosynthesis
MQFFNKSILLFIPCRNCETSIVEVISNIPQELRGQIECLIIDNQSTDSTSELVFKEINNENHPFKINLIKTKNDIGYAGSQKLAYLLATQSPNVKYVIMLHGDGQYDPSLLKDFVPLINNKYAIVNGFRDKRTYPHREETPFITYYIIKILSWFESLITGHTHKEWHSGFVMYDSDFLRKIPLQFLSDIPHIDAEFLICAGILNENTKSIPIYKNYDGYEAFCGLPRIRHVLNVFKIMFKFRIGYYHTILTANNVSKINYKYDIIA